MVDPLWAWTPDVILAGHTYYCPDPPDYAEARCTEPTDLNKSPNTPTLPEGYFVGCLSIEDLDTDSEPEGYSVMICAPTDISEERVNILPCPPTANLV